MRKVHSGNAAVQNGEQISAIAVRMIACIKINVGEKIKIKNYVNNYPLFLIFPSF
jgi:hypothetical protein